MTDFLASSEIPSDTYSAEQLVIGGGVKTLAGQTIKTTAGIVTRLTVLALVSTFTAATAAKTGGNTGNATIAMDGTTPTLGFAQAGAYQVRMLTATTFRVYDPRGRALGDGVNGTAFSNQVKFTVTTGGTPMVAGDGFDITLTQTGTKWAKAVYAAADTTSEPKGILVEQVNTTSGDAVGQVYVAGEFAMQGLVWDTSYDTDAKKLAAFPPGSTIQVKKLLYSMG